MTATTPTSKINAVLAQKDPKRLVKQAFLDLYSNESVEDLLIYLAQAEGTEHATELLLNELRTRGARLLEAKLRDRYKDATVDAIWDAGRASLSEASRRVLSRILQERHNQSLESPVDRAPAVVRRHTGPGSDSSVRLENC